MAKNNFIYIEISKGMYGLKQAGFLAFQDLNQHLQPHGFYHSLHTPGLWLHYTKPISFTLVVDDFGIKYTNKDDVLFLQSILQKKYTITTDWSGTRYCGLQLQWNFNKQYLDIIMPAYIPNVLTQYKHPIPSKPEHSPSACIPIKYGQHSNIPTPIDTSPILPPKQIKWLQQ